MFSVTSEHGCLKTVLVFQPGPEVEQGFPGPLALHPYLGKEYWNLFSVQQQFNRMVELLHRKDVEVLEVRQLLGEILEVDLRGVLQEILATQCDNYLQYRGGWPKPEEAVEDLIVGVPQPIDPVQGVIILPLKYAHWVRDQAFVVGEVVCLSSVIERRRGGTQLIRSVVRHHPRFANCRVLDFETYQGVKVEGGDVMVFSPEVVLIGAMSRTDFESARQVASILLQEVPQLRVVYVVEISKLQGVIHLDQVFAMVGDRAALAIPYVFDEPLAYVQLAKPLGDRIQADTGCSESDLPFQTIPGRLWVVERDRVKEGKPLLQQLRTDGLLDETLWIGGGRSDYQNEFEHFRVAWREATRQAGNVLCVAPWQILAYGGRNPNTESSLGQFLQRQGGELLTFDGSELDRGQGGPHCLTMPLRRS